MGPNDFNQRRRRRPPAQGQGGARPLPNDEYGDSHRQVNEAYGRETNFDIAGQYPSDGNLSGLQYMYGQEGIPSEPYTEGPGLTGADMNYYRNQQHGLDGARRAYGREFGDAQSHEVVDDLLRLRAQRDIHGYDDTAATRAYDMPQAPGVERWVEPQFGFERNREITSREPTDGNHAGFEEYYGPGSYNAGRPTHPRSTTPDHSGRGNVFEMLRRRGITPR